MSAPSPCRSLRYVVKGSHLPVRVCRLLMRFMSGIELERHDIGWLRRLTVFDVTVLKASHRSLPEVTDEFAETVKPGLNAESLVAELRKAVDEEDL